MSQHTCEVVPVVLEKHPDADKLSIVKVWGYQVVVRTEDWDKVDRGVYIPPDSIVPNKGQFKFLYQDHMQSSKNPGRVRVRKFRGVVSQGLLVPAPKGAQIGQDFMQKWGIDHYVSPLERVEEAPLTWWDRLANWLLAILLRDKKLRRKQRSQVLWDQPIRGPSKLCVPKYDVQNFNRHPNIIEEGEEVYITEKIHGCNARFVFHEGEFYVGSRTQWKKQHANNLWWKAVGQNLWIEEWCRAHPGLVLYGEVFGQVQDLKYDTESSELKCLAFDVLDQGCWLNYAALGDIVPYTHRVPLVYLGTFCEVHARALAERQSSIATHCREGIVICTTEERSHASIGRKQLKIVSNRYMERGK